MGACARNMQSDPAEIKPAQCCIKLVFHLTYTMMHGSTKLKFCFRCLANGELLASLVYFFRVGKNTVQGIVRESRKAIQKVLQPVHIKQSLLRKHSCEFWMSSTKFVQCLIAYEAQTGNTASSNAHQMQDLCILTFWCQNYYFNFSTPCI